MFCSVFLFGAWHDAKIITFWGEREMIVEFRGCPVMFGREEVRKVHVWY